MQLAAHAADVRLEIVGRRLAVVERLVTDAALAARAHGPSPFRAHRAVGIAPDFPLELAPPLRLTVPSVGRKQGVVVHGQEAAVQRAGRADVGNVLGITGTVEYHARL